MSGITGPTGPIGSLCIINNSPTGATGATGLPGATGATGVQGIASIISFTDNLWFFSGSGDPTFPVGLLQLATLNPAVFQDSNFNLIGEQPLQTGNTGIFTPSRPMAIDVSVMFYASGYTTGSVSIRGTDSLNIARRYLINPISAAQVIFCQISGRIIVSPEFPLEIAMEFANETTILGGSFSIEFIHYLD